jgi:hypothetical protein
MLASVTGGLLSGLEMQAEMSELLEEIYYESLSKTPESRSPSGLRHDGL